MTQTNNDFAKLILQWFKHSGRKDLPWQKNPTPYRVWVSEVMLQQTQVKTVIPYFEKFMHQFPSITHLAASSEDKVLALWSGLGYYSRARNLHKTAIQLCSHKDTSKIGVFPDTVESLIKLPGIGRSTAGAILALSMIKQATILDGNVKRVLGRCFAIEGWPGQSKIAKQYWQIAEILTPENNIKEYTQAIMDLGSIICTPKNYQCEICPLNQICQANQHSNQDLYPSKKPKTNYPVKHQYFCLLVSQSGELLFEKRPPSGIWGGLWTPISCDENINLGEYLSIQYSIEASNQKRLELIKHKFSHYQLNIVPVRANVTKMIAIAENQLQWRTPDDWLSEAIPKPVRTMILQLIEDLKKD